MCTDISVYQIDEYDDADIAVADDDDDGNN